MLPFPDYILPVLFVFDGGIFERMSGMRLIDVDEITDGEIVKYLGKEYGSCVPDVRDLLKDQPTAFYVEKVCTVKYLTEHSVDNRKNQFVSETEDVESGSAFRTIGVFSLPGICMIT